MACSILISPIEIGRVNIPGSVHFDGILLFCITADTFSPITIFPSGLVFPAMNSLMNLLKVGIFRACKKGRLISSLLNISTRSSVSSFFFLASPRYGNGLGRFTAFVELPAGAAPVSLLPSLSSNSGSGSRKNGSLSRGIDPLKSPSWRSSCIGISLSPGSSPRDF